MILAAVNSARVNTNLEPILLFDGQENEFLETLRKKGVKVIFHRVGFYDALKERDKTNPGYLSIASGAFLRVEIPLIEQDEEFVLYTDCDILFTSDAGLLDVKPEYFACAPQQSMNDYAGDANSGVLVLNVKNMRQTYAQFSEFIVKNLYAGWPGCDQENYRRFYAGKWDKLPLIYNWKPYWGLNQDCSIIHWHGPKPEAVLNRLLNPYFEFYSAWEELFSKNVPAYKQYYEMWDRYCDASPRYNHSSATNISGHVDGYRVEGGKKLVLTGWSYLLGVNDSAALSVESSGKVYPVESFTRKLRPDVARSVKRCPENCGYFATVSIDSDFKVENMEISFHVDFPETTVLEYLKL
ncbi:MAG: hypothetical protein LRY72_17430 [Saccharospirillaceae bacterium]|nr:hypothetical protein [Saccharospirillaceae bacterium]